MISNFNSVEFTYNGKIDFLLARIWVQSREFKAIHDQYGKLIYKERRASALPFLIILSVKKKSVEKYTWEQSVILR